MSIEFWFSICLSFVGIALSFFTYITKKEKTGAIIAVIISFIIAIVFFTIGLINLNKQNNPETLSNQLQTTTTLKQSSNATSSTLNAMFSNYFITSSPSNISTYLNLWNSSKDKDIQGNYHQYEVGLKLSCSKYWYINENVSTSDIHLVYNPNYKGNTNFSGKIVLSDASSGSLSSADISILIDGKEVWKSDQKLTGSTITPIEFAIDLKHCKEEVIIRTTSYLQDDNGIEIGFF